jgi:hypothetical protein
MKITFGRIFETSLIAKTKSFKELQPLIEWLQQAIDNLARVSTGAVTLGDNIDASTYVQKVKSASLNVSVEFKVNKVPAALFVSKQAPTTPVVSAFSWQILPNGNCQANFIFTAAPTLGVDVSLVAFNA